MSEKHSCLLQKLKEQLEPASNVGEEGEITDP